MVEIHADLDIHDYTKEATAEVMEAARLALRDVTVESHREAAHNSPKRSGHNRRSLASEVSGMGVIAQGSDEGDDSEPDGHVVDDNEIESALYSTSGYGGYLETGTSKMREQPYIQPAVMRNFTEEKFGGAMREHLGEK